MALKLANPNGQENAREIAQALAEKFGIPNEIRVRKGINKKYYYLNYQINESMDIHKVNVHNRKIEWMLPNSVTIGCLTFRQDGSFKLQITDRRNNA